MRLVHSLVAATLCAGMLLPTASFAEEPTPAVDLVAAFVLGAKDGETLGVNGDSNFAVMERMEAGKFEGAPAGEPGIAFEVTDKGGCVYDIAFSQDSKLLGAIEVDANKLKAVTYDELGKKETFTSYKVTLVGGEGVVQLLSADGKLSPTEPSSSLSTSLAVDDMQAAVTEFQSTYCKAAA